MKKVFKVNETILIVGLLLTGLLCVAYAGKAPGKDIALNGCFTQFGCFISQKLIH